MITFIFLYLFQIAALVIYLWMEFAELRGLIKKAENNILTLTKNEIRNESTKDNK